MCIRDSTWGRALINWTGTVRLGDEVIEVSGAMGVGEFTRVVSSSSEAGAASESGPGLDIGLAGARLASPSLCPEGTRKKPGEELDLRSRRSSKYGLKPGGELT